MIVDNYMILDDYYELLNLNKALLEAKFNEFPNDEYITGSPIIAQICNEVVQLLSEKKAKDSWNEWRKWENHTKLETRVIASICYVRKDWLNLNIDEKRKIILDNISPFIANEEDIMKIITKVNALYHE